MIKFKDFRTGDFVTFYALVYDFKLRYTINQTPYYSLALADGDLVIDARVWDINLKDDISVGSIYKFEAKINDFGGKTQAIISSITDTTDADVNWQDFFRFAPIKEQELRVGIKCYQDKIKNPVLSNLVNELIADVSDAYFSFPAGLTMHHNYICGLAYHIFSMLRLADTFLEIYPSLNADLLYAGVLLHDIGKTKELTDAKLPSYSLAGNLLGHLVIGVQLVSALAKKQGVEETQEYLTLTHLLIAHHGELEYGSPKEPLMMEAHALFLIDNLDSRLAAMHEEVIRTTPGDYTAPIATLNRNQYFVPKLYVAKLK